MKDRPLISLVICCYKQQDLVAEAVRGALAQTYQPLEIIISDDCSPDRTYEVILETVAATPSPHRVIPFQTPKNLGLVPHFNHLVAEFAAGELIVCGAGDDISLPDRVEKLWKFWEETGQRFFSITSGVRRLDFAGRELPAKLPPTRMVEPGELTEAFTNNRLFVSGCAQMFHRDIYREFGPLQTLHVEDTGIAFRAAILGGVGYLPDLLVVSTVGDGSISFVSDYKARISRYFTLTRESTAQYRRDLQTPTALDRLSAAEIDKLTALIKSGDEVAANRYCCAYGKSMAHRFAAWSKMLSRQSWKNSLKDFSLLFPEKVYFSIRALWNAYR